MLLSYLLLFRVAQSSETRGPPFFSVCQKQLPIGGQEAFLFCLPFFLAAITFTYLAQNMTSAGGVKDIMEVF